MLVTTETMEALPGFGTLDPETLDAVRAISREISIPRDALLCRQGSPPELLHYLLDGQVTLTQAASNGDIGVIDVLGPVRGIGLANVVTGDAHQMTARTISDARLLEIRADPLRHMLGQRPSLVSTMLQGLSLDLDAVTRHVIDLKLRTAAQRLGCYLLRLAHGVEDNYAAFTLPIRKQLLAAQLGCRQENLSRAFAILRDVGVETHGGRVILHDLAALRQYAVPDDNAPRPGWACPQAGVAPAPRARTAPAPSRAARAFSGAFDLR